MPEDKKNWERQICAGGIVYKKDANGVFVLLIQPKGPNYGPAVGYWTFPKGKLDSEDEDKKVAALREVREEGGVVGIIEAELGYVKFFRHAGPGFSNAIKFVHFYLMAYVSGDPAGHDEEVAEAGWFALADIESKLRFPHDMEVFQRARKDLDARQ